MGSLLNNRKNLSLILVINVVYMVCDSSAATFEKTNKSPLADQLKEEQQQRPSPQDMFGSMGRSFEEELEQRLLLSNLLENNNNHLDRFYYNGVPSEDSYGLDGPSDENYPMPNEEKRSSPSSSLFNVFRRGCIRRGGNCDSRPNDCCYSSSCRCNLWGSNCRCQRMGLFQKWG